MKKIAFITLFSLGLTAFVTFLALNGQEPEALVVDNTEEVSLTEEEVETIQTFAEENNIGYFEAVALFKLAEVTEYTKEELLVLEREELLDLALEVTEASLDLEALRARIEERLAAYNTEKETINQWMETYDLPLSNALMIRLLINNDETLLVKDLAELSEEALKELIKVAVEEERDNLRTELAPYLEEARSRFEEWKQRFEENKDFEEETSVEPNPST
jgi:hypothetical protein